MIRKNQLSAALFLSMIAICLTGCSTAGRTAADLGLAGAGGIAGYQLSKGSIGGAAIGAATGYVASKVVQSEVQQAESDAEKRGYDRGVNQAVKQQYWIIQNQQRAGEDLSGHYVQVKLPAQTINGVTTNPRTEYIKVYP